MAEQATMSVPPIFETAKRVYAGALLVRSRAAVMDASTGGKLGIGKIVDGLLDKYFFNPISSAGTVAINAPLKELLPHLGVDPENPQNMVQRQEVRSALNTIASVEMVDVFFDALLGLIPKKEIDTLVTGLHEIGPFQEQLEQQMLQMNERTMIARAQAAAERSIEESVLASGTYVDPNLLELKKREAAAAAKAAVEEKIKSHEIFIPTDHIEMPEDGLTAMNLLPMPKRIIQGVALFIGGALTLRYRLQENPFFKPFYNILSPLFDKMQKSTIRPEEAERIFNAHFTSPAALSEALYNPVSSGLDLGKALAIYEMAIPNADGTGTEPAFAAMRTKPKFKGKNASEQDTFRYNIASTGETLAYIQSFHQSYGQLMQKYNGIMALTKEVAAGLAEQASFEGVAGASGLLGEEDHMLSTEQLRAFFKAWIEEPQGLNSSLTPLHETFRDALSSGEPYNTALIALHVIRDQVIKIEEHKVIFDQAVADIAREHQNPYFKLSDGKNIQADHEKAQAQLTHVRDTGFDSPGSLLHLVLSGDISRRDVSLAMQSLPQKHGINSKTTFAQARMDRDFESDYLASTIPNILDKADAIIEITRKQIDAKEQKRAFSKQLKRMDADLGSLKLAEGEINEEVFALSLAMHWLSDDCRERLTTIIEGMERQKEFDHITLADIHTLTEQARQRDDAGMDTFKKGGSLGEAMAEETGKANSKRKQKADAETDLVESSKDDARKGAKQAQAEV